MIVVWRVVDRCNLSCPFCAFDKRLSFARSNAEPGTLLSFARHLVEYQNLTGDNVMISWLGGEPFLWKPLQELSAAIHGMGLKISATTNGTTLGNTAARAHIIGNYDELTISIDGFSALHNAMRGWPGGFEKLQHRVPLLFQEARAVNARLRLRANVVLMHQTVDAFSKLYEELATWGIDEITFNQLGGRDRPEFYPAHRLTVDDVKSLEIQLHRIRRTLSDKGISLIGGPKYIDRFYSSARGEPNPITDCRPGENFLFIDERNRITPCSFTSDDYAVPVHEIRSGADIAALPSRFRHQQSATPSAACADCLSTQVCDKFQSEVQVL